MVSDLSPPPLQSAVARESRSDQIAVLLTEDDDHSSGNEPPRQETDYLGFSKWEFKHGDRAAGASIKDYACLQRFQAGEIVLRPGDALCAIVKSEIARGFEGSIVETRHEIVKILEVVPLTSADQGKFS